MLCGGVTRVATARGGSVPVPVSPRRVASTSPLFPLSPTLPGGSIPVPVSPVPRGECQPTLRGGFVPRPGVPALLVGASPVPVSPCQVAMPPLSPCLHTPVPPLSPRCVVMPPLFPHAHTLVTPLSPHPRSPRQCHPLPLYPPRRSPLHPAQAGDSPVPMSPSYVVVPPLSPYPHAPMLHGSATPVPVSLCCLAMPPTSPPHVGCASLSHHPSSSQSVPPPVPSDPCLGW